VPYSAIANNVGFSIEVNEPGWLHARTIGTIGMIEGKIGLAVYRSGELRDTDPIYAPVAEFLEQNHHVLVREDVIPDPDMMFGSGLAQIYDVYPQTNELPLEGVA